MCKKLEHGDQVYYYENLGGKAGTMIWPALFLGYRGEMSACVELPDKTTKTVRITSVDKSAWRGAVNEMG